MSTVELWVVIIGLSGVTLLTRASMLFLPPRLQLSLRLQRALRYAGPCILMAIVVPDLLRHDGAISVGFDNIRLVAALVAVAAFFVTRSAPVTIVIGMLCLTALRLFG